MDLAALPKSGPERGWSIPVYNASLAASSGAAPMSAGHEKMKFVRGAEPVTKADKRLAAKEMAKHGKDKIDAKMAIETRR